MRPVSWLMLIFPFFPLAACASAAVAPTSRPAAATAAVATGQALPPATTDPRPVDPALVEGHWDYRTRSNCGSVEGVGAVELRWNHSRQHYDENGHVCWADSKTTIRWWGFVRYDPAAKRLVGELSNSLGDKVRGNWKIEGLGPDHSPDRLVLRWKQTNGCYGIGIASRGGWLLTRARVRRLIYRLRSGDRQTRLQAIRQLGQLGHRGHPAREALQEALAEPDPEIRDAAAKALEQIQPKIELHPPPGS